MWSANDRETGGAYYFHTHREAIDYASHSCYLARLDARHVHLSGWWALVILAAIIIGLFVLGVVT